MGACCCKNTGYTKLNDPEFRSFPPLQHNYEQNAYTRQYPTQLIEANKNSWETMRHFKMVFLGESTAGKTSLITQKVSYKFEKEYQPTIEDYYVKVHRLNVEDINAYNSYKQSINSHQSKQSFSQRYDNSGNNYNNLPCYHCILDIQDTSGSLDFRQNINQWIWRSQVFVIVFDLANRNSFVNIENAFISRIIELRKCSQPPIILIGNKSDQINANTIVDIHSRRANAEINMVQTGTDNAPDLDTHGSDGNKDKRQVTLDMIEDLCNKYNIPYIECSAKDRININHIFDVCVKERLFHEAYWKKHDFMEQRTVNDMY